MYIHFIYNKLYSGTDKSPAGMQRGTIRLIYITGDIHGDKRRFEDAKRLRSGDTLLICGDFGFLWDGGVAEERFLKKLGKKKYAIAFVDGAHENFELLNRCEEGEWNGGRVHCLGGNIYHLMRGEVYTIEGKTFFAFGGGETRERQIYQDAGKWWKEEFPTLEEMKNGAARLQAHGKRVDYIVTHWPAPRMARNHGDRNALDAYFDTLAREIEYKRWYFGYLHSDRKRTAKNFSVFQEILPVE